MVTNISSYLQDNQTIQFYHDLLDPTLSLTDMLNVTSYSAMSFGKMVLCYRTIFSYVLPGMNIFINIEDKCFKQRKRCGDHPLF